MDKRRFIVSTLIAWLIFIMIDFIAHASVLSPLWLEEQPALKPLDDLAKLIPAGYFSFLVLTALTGWMYTGVYKSNPGFGTNLKFGAIFGGLFGLSNFFGMYSFISLPALNLFANSVVYFL